MIHAQSLAQRLAYMPLLVIGLVLGQSGEAAPSCDSYSVSSVSYTENEDGSTSIHVEITSNSGPVAADTYVDLGCWWTTPVPEDSHIYRPGEEPQPYRLELSTVLIPAGGETGSGTVKIIPITDEEEDEEDEEAEGEDEEDTDSQSTTTGSQGTSAEGDGDSQSTTTASQGTSAEGAGASTEGQTVPSLHPQTLETSGGDQQGPAGAALDEPFVVVVRDQNGDLLAGVQVAFTVTAGGGTLSSASATTDANGRAQTYLTLGSEPGTNTVEASVAGLEPVTFTAVGYANPRSLEKISGDGQEGPASTQLAEPLMVAVADEDGAAIAGVAVSFAVTAGGGTLSSATATTDANGRATTRLTLGRDLGTNTVEVSVTGLEPETFTATATEQAIPYSLAKVRGENQEGPVGTQLAEPLVVAVADEDGAAIAGVAVSFAVTAGGGTLSTTTATTNADGRARTYLTLGSELGTNTVEVSVEGLESVTFTATGQESPLANLFDAFLNGSGKLVGLPDRPQLQQNAPNPFNSQTVLSYFLPTAGPARLTVFTLTGQQVVVLHQGPQQAGYHRLRWNGRDDAGRPVASGVYLYRLVTDERVLTRKLTLLR